MGDQEILQRGAKVLIDSKGRKTRQPTSKAEIDEQIEANDGNIFTDYVKGAQAKARKFNEDQTDAKRDTVDTIVGKKAGGKITNLFKGKETMSEELNEAKAIKSGKITPMQYAKGEKKEEAKKFAKGGSIDGIAQRGKTRGKMC